MTFESVAEDPNMGTALQALVQRAKGVLVFPQVLRGAFVVGAAGPVGVGAEAASANLMADLINYSRAKGLYAGISLEGRS